MSVWLQMVDFIQFNDIALIAISMYYSLKQVIRIRKEPVDTHNLGLNVEKIR